MDINATNLRGIYTSLSTIFNQSLAATQTFYSTIAMTVGSTTFANEYPRLDELPGFREWIGDRVAHDVGASLYSITNRSFEKTIAIKKRQIEDDQVGIFTPIAAQYGQDGAAFPDTLVWPLLKKGETTTCYDGQYYFDTDHPGYNEQGNQISVANYAAGAQPAWYLIDDTQVIKPMIWQSRKALKLTQLFSETDPNVFWRDEYVWGADTRGNAGFGLWQLAFKSKLELTQANYEAARTAMQSIRKRDGQINAIRPTKLLVPPALERQARQIVEAALINGGETNVWAKTATVVSVPHLA
ncbi:head protein [Agrobacterium sp. TS43]|uniref:Mu-like prophage major head subunit gpT family protein n=1 Tax=Agrobacterium TaxID=357 RepID=UPI00049F3524|nr:MULTISPECIES: Mu-like prophage major head subunit gpT family protein [Agrobacterium]KDR87305.1 Mu-like prophage major head subunit gpT [Agrobacterium tumefaciens GW4]KVK40053.1 head protein [Agrobacterium sp. LY4]KVK51345.1 head protein [Agrobacterium sp. JL28]KVK63540.1 head protein [Agrobacterium sp. TS45]KVK67969.1 head protein [Agrobacterium sp. C13]